MQSRVYNVKKVRRCAMEKIITAENIRSFAYVNENAVKGNVRGIVLQFTGLGNQQRYANETLEGEYYGAEGLLYVIPYNNPWCWMNRQAVDFVDEIIDVLAEKYNLEVIDFYAITNGCSHFTDGVHLTNEGYYKLANEVVNAVKKVI